jgi:hypothetical protein
MEAESYSLQFSWSEDLVADSYEWWLSRANADGVYEVLWDIVYTEVEMTSAITSALPFNFYIEPHKYLRTGNYRWWVRGYSSVYDTYGPWSAPMDFDILATDTVGKVTLRYPLATAESDFVAFSWDKDEHATWYAFSLYNSSDAVYVNSAAGEWFKLEDLNDDSDIITLKYGTKLTLGKYYSWWVKGWNASGGDGLWSNIANFVCADRPAVTLVEPATTAPSGPLTFSCTEDPAATWYELYVAEGTESAYSKIYDVWYKIDTKDIYDPTPIAVYNNGNRDMTCTFRFESGKNYVWWVRTWGYNIYGPWSDAKEFLCA